MKKLLLIALFLLIPQGVGATAYYVDFTVGIVNGNGLATTTPFNNLDSFTEVARSAGDIAFVRRNTASTTNVTDLNFTSDGTIANPIIISADNDNLWNDASTTAQTYTVAVATSTFTASATITNVTAGDWFYVTGDCTQTYNSLVLNQCEYFYEVASISGTQLTLYTPYKGDQTGAGNSLVNLGKNPQWNVVSGDFQWLFSGDYYWEVRNMDIRGTDNVGTLRVTSSNFVNVKDSIINANGVGDRGVQIGTGEMSFKKSRVFNANNAIFMDDSAIFTANNSIFDCNGIASASGLVLNTGIRQGRVEISNSFVRNCTTYINNSADMYQVTSKNVKISGETTIFDVTASLLHDYFFEDFDGEIGNSKFVSRYINLATDDSFNLLSTTTVIRSGGGAVSIQNIPTTNTGFYSPLKLFEYPIYTNTVSKQYDVYFMSTSTAAWTADPLATELWIECEYWAHATNATSTRKIKKSTGVVDFNGSTAWQALSVTCQPTQTGILYLRGWYAKTKETPMNEFFVDGTPVIN